MSMPRRILIVEDEPSIVDNIVFGLKQEGFDSHWRRTAAEAKQALRDETFCLAILDVGLPDQSGFELCKAIRENSPLPIVFLTARSEEIDRIVGLEIGADDYLTKPFSVRELVARVKVILRRAGDDRETKNGATSVAAEKTFRIGPFSIDEERYTISLGNHPLPLPRYEYRLLRELLTSGGRVLTRDQLMYRVWEEPEASGERTVDAHVKCLRAKLREAGGDPAWIRTHRGIGYSFALKDS